MKTIALAQGGGTPQQAQVVAAECVTLAETKDHLNWELIGEVVKRLTGDAAKVLRAAHKEVEEQEDEHLYHNSGWARELWIEGLGLPGSSPASRGAEGGQDRHRRRQGQAGPPRHDLIVRPAIRQQERRPAVPGTRANVKNEKQYEALKDKGMSKQRAAKIANSPDASKKGGKKSGSGGNAKQGGTTAQHKAAGRKGGRAAAKKK